MHIEHIALFTNDLEKMKIFYTKYFHCKTSERYDNIKNNFSSYFLSFQDGVRIEIMQQQDITKSIDNPVIGLAHFAINIGTKEKVNNLTDKFRKDGFDIYSYPRTTGDGYYESVILDPDKNKIELIAINDYEISEAVIDDLENILYLQKCCYLSEAEIYNNYSIPPLTQTIESMSNDFVRQTFFKLVYREKIIGSVRAYVQENTCYVGKLIVDRNYQNMGFGKLLLQTVEDKFKSMRYELFTGYQSEKNLYLYKKHGYQEFKEERQNGMVIKYLEKVLSQ